MAAFAPAPGPAAGERPLLVAQLTETIARELVNARNGQHSEETPVLSGDEEDPVFRRQTTPLAHRTSTLEANRQEYEETRRDLAVQILQATLVGSCILMSLFALLTAGLILATVVIYFVGWFTWISYRAEPCDQPLEWWLFGKLMLFPLNIIVLFVYRRCVNSDNESCLKKVYVAYGLVVMGTSLAIGIWLIRGCKTCQDTNPSLYRFVRFYLIFQSIAWGTSWLIRLALPALILCLRSMNLLPQGQVPAPGLARRLETVAYSPELFTRNGEPEECCICQEEFSEAGTIKRTPCGHHFHEACLTPWLEKYANICPLCRSNLQELFEREDATE